MRAQSLPLTSQTEVLLPIAAVERETGLGKDTLRVWERRYGFPSPKRDANGNRAYPEDQVQRLRSIKRLLDQGLRPGAVFAMNDRELNAHIGASISAHVAALQVPKSLTLHWSHLMQRQGPELRQLLTQDLARLGLAAFLERVVSPLNDLIGTAWAVGDIQVFDEHLYTEAITRVLSQAIGALQYQQTLGRPLVILTTLPGESHGLGLLMAEAMLTLHGAQCIALGTQTPLNDIVEAAQVHRADIVALSFSAYPGARQVTQGVQALLSTLHARTLLWVGGSSARLNSMRHEQLRTFSDLASIQEALEAWRLNRLN